MRGLGFRASIRIYIGIIIGTPRFLGNLGFWA